LCFVFSFISPFVLCLHSVSNFYFTSQYHQFPLSHAAAAAAAAAAARRPKREKRKQKKG
jgi:hypothetical protein